ncbi:hypothetical protein M1M34_gp018 [Haloarcula tailed virus 2]|uniref:Uncharacterized protein n=1 Tax=Haloarcula tailed virus 2 TaxID=2877989 RepID=A0AAE9BYR4_9CAUD|nr:hypothetical protein M1M34_gp018 [Haloarcula tailed virus 2]UBF23169.1 hypothetical protein HATV-2_gp18 [Haloarcula tailed virus 2]
MATRLEILETFYDELVSSVNGVVPSDDVSLINPDNLETTPAVVYDKNWRIVNYNGVGTAPDRIERDANGNVTAEVFTDYIEAQFFVHIRAESQSEVETIYNAIYQHFQKWKFSRLAKITTFHPDAIRTLEIREVNSADDPSADATFRGDVLEIVVQFKSEIDNVEDVIEDVSLDQDGAIYITD